ncbi:MAG: hypothetical protein KDE09_19890 [Anaerolineales bacterium]|nr:hypothetical protein [Anaerolineales bacterium]MCB0011451.1 hypothetical protein [Anaerolineales bacterium]MCB0020067.1 hypothetical protein [Anaerolineales bacterium]MCB0026559.1 hypothetical protein [Anaerolineales bacterium]MCB8959201.1 hypothetical protein [Ardenticatenales bacterium]
MNIETFQSLSTLEIAAVVRSNQINVCSFTFNGTRRWFQLEHPDQSHDLRAYIDALTSQVIHIAEMLFAHGLDTVIMPVISRRVLENRDDAYRAVALPALQFLLTDQKFLNFYEDYQVDAFIYGEFEGELSAATAQQLRAQYRRFQEEQPTGRKRRIFWGICATDTATTLIQQTVAHLKEYNQPPSRADLVRGYYGADVASLDIHIGSGKPQVFDVPLLMSGRESLYFMTAPSPYFSAPQLRTILFDHIYGRAPLNRYDRISPHANSELGAFYRYNAEHTLGVGHFHQPWGVWHPEDQPLIFPEPELGIPGIGADLVLTGQ